MPDRLTAAERVAANVKLLRARRGWTQAELAANSGASENRIWGLEVGRRRVTVDDLAEFSNVFGVTPERMLSNDPEAEDAVAKRDPVYEVTVDGGLTHSVAAGTVDTGETWTAFYLRGTQTFLAPTARILGIRLITEEDPDA